jgi:hypothetical protein
MAEQRLAYNYALIDETGWCYEVRSTSMNCDDEEGFIPIPECDPDYTDKYYNVADGKWYLEASFTTEWIPE